MSSLVPLLSLAGFAIVAVMRITDPLLPVIAQDFDATVGQAGVVVTAFALGYGLFQLAFGPLGDKLGKLRVIAVTLGSAVLFVAGCAFAPSLQALAALRFFTGVACAAAIPLTIAWIGDTLPPSEHQTTIARYSTGIIFGQMVGSGFGGMLGDWVGWRGVFLVFTALMLPIALLLWRQARTETPPRDAVSLALADQLDRYRLATRSPAANAVLIAAFTEGFCLFGGMAFLGALLHTRFDLSFTLIGLLLVGYGVGGLVYSMASGWLLRRYSRRHMMQLGGALIAVAFMVFAKLPHWSVAAVLTVLIGLGFYLMHNTLQTLALELIPGARGTSFGLFAFTLFAGQGLGVWLLGHLIDRQGYTLTFMLLGCCIGGLGLWLAGCGALRRQLNA